MQAPTILVLDVDGTLVDSTYLHTVCWWQAFRGQGYDPAMAAVHRAVGMGADHLVPHLVGAVTDERRDELAAEHDRLWREWWPLVRPTRGAADLLRTAAAAGSRVVLASSARSEELDAMRRVIDADDVIADVVGAGEVDASKPDPDVLAVALERSGRRAEDALFVGDSVWDGQAAGTAGVRFVGVQCGGTSSAELTGAGALAVYADPAELAEALRAGVRDAGHTRW